MAIPKIQFTPIMARTGKVVHVTMLMTPNATVCGKKCHRWIVALKPLSCTDCKRVVFLVAPRRKAKAR